MTPRAVLFDYGGVLSEVVNPPDGPQRLAETISALLSRAGQPMDTGDVFEDLQLGMRAYDGLKRAQSRMPEPAEIDHRAFWELTCCDWAPGPRGVLLANATPLCRALELTVIVRPARAEAAGVLRLLRRQGVRTALVCNCLSGDAARAQLEQDGLTGLLDVEVYSDELGYRKPGARLLHAALGALDVPPAHAWLVGDKINRDILAARRAGLSKAVLFRTAAGPGGPLRGIEPDYEIEALSELPGLLGLGDQSG